MKITNKEIKKIFYINLKITPKEISKIRVNISKNIYDIDNKYILKISNETNKITLKKAYFLMTFFKNKMPCPKVICFDDSKKIIPYCYGIYEKIKGENLINIWHDLTDKQREIAVKHICNKLLLPLYTTEYDSRFKKFARGRFGLNPNINWHDAFTFEINNKLKDIKKKKLLPQKQINRVNNFILKNKYLLYESNLKLTYWDLNFNNIIIDPKTKKIAGFIDFDAICYSSIDYPLLMIKRMSIEPEFFAMNLFKYIKKKDYKSLMKLFQKYNPDMFKFTDLSIRLDLYLLERRLRFLLKYPKSKIVSDQIYKIIDKY